MKRTPTHFRTPVVNLDIPSFLLMHFYLQSTLYYSRPKGLLH